MLLHTSNGIPFLIDDEHLPLVQKHTWWARRSRHRGKVLTFYVTTHHNRVALHRLLTGAAKGAVVDHRNGNGLDNRACNLRVCTPQENGKNRRIDSRKRSGFKGVSSNARRKARGLPHWKASIRANGKDWFLGFFKTPEEGSAAYNSAAERFHGEYARTNVIAAMAQQ